jgi:hypothetical protein
MSLLKKLLKHVPVVGGVLSAASSLLGSNKQAKAAKQASQMQMNMFGNLQQQQQPFLQAGYGANAKLSQLLGVGGDPGSADYGSLMKSFTPADYLANADPGYEFQRQQGEQALRNAAGAGSGAIGGAALKDLLKYNQDYAGTAYQGAFNRFQTQQGNIFSRLSGLLGVGQNASNTIAQAGTGLVGSAGNFTAGAGSATGAGIVGAGNSASDALTNYWLMKQFGQPTSGMPNSGGQGSYDLSNPMMAGG